MLVCETPADLAAHAGRLLGTSDWIRIPQSDVNAFAALTSDRQWIHVDVERAGRELPEGKTIVHGYLLLAMLPAMFRTIYEVRQRRQAINYGMNKVRFITPVKVGVRLRLHTRLVSAEDIAGGGLRFIFEQTVEIEGAAKPALVAETIVAMYS